MSPVARLSVGWLATADTRRGNRPGSAGAPTSSIPCHGLRPRPRRSQSHQVGLRTQSRFPTRREPREPSERRLTDVTVPSPDDNPRPRPGAAGATRTRSGPPSMRERHDAPGRRLVRCVPDGTGMFRATQSSARPRREFCVAFLPVGSAHIRRDAGRVDPASQPGGITISTWRPSAFVLERETQSGARTAHDDATAEPKRTRVRHEVPMEPAAHSASSGDDRRTCFTRVAS